MQVIERERERVRTPSKDQQQERLIDNQARSKCNARYRARERESVWTPSKKQRHETLINNQARSKCNGGSYRQRD
jgi:hypothetical protein